MTGQYLELKNADAVSGASLHGLTENRFWRSGRSAELKPHRIHAYPAKFPAFIPTKVNPEEDKGEAEYVKKQMAQYKEEAELKSHDPLPGREMHAVEERKNSLYTTDCDTVP